MHKFHQLPPYSYFHIRFQRSPPDKVRHLHCVRIQTVYQNQYLAKEVPKSNKGKATATDIRILTGELYLFVSCPIEKTYTLDHAGICRNPLCNVAQRRTLVFGFRCS